MTTSSRLPLSCPCQHRAVMPDADGFRVNLHEFASGSMSSPLGKPTPQVTSSSGILTRASRGVNRGAALVHHHDGNIATRRKECFRFTPCCAVTDRDNLDAVITESRGILFPASVPSVRTAEVMTSWWRSSLPDEDAILQPVRMPGSTRAKPFFSPSAVRGGAGGGCRKDPRAPAVGALFVSRRISVSIEGARRRL